MKYAEEPFPYEYSEQDLYENIRRDIRDYAQGNLDIAVKSPSECWQQEREYLQNRYTEQSFKMRELEDDILELEQVLAENCLERPKIAKRWVEEAAEPF